MRNNILSLTAPFIYLGIFSVFMAFLLVFFTWSSNQRKENIYKNYAQETNDYILKNKEGLQKIFTEDFPTKPCDIYDYNRNPCEDKSGNQVAKLLSSDLKDISSMALIKNIGEQIIELRISGEIKNFNTTNDAKKEKVLQLLSGREDYLPWDDYTYDFSGKEVLIPVKDNNGQVLGVIVRGVIEK